MADYSTFSWKGFMIFHIRVYYSTDNDRLFYAFRKKIPYRSHKTNYSMILTKDFFLCEPIKRLCSQIWSQSIFLIRMKLCKNAAGLFQVIFKFYYSAVSTQFKRYFVIVLFLNGLSLHFYNKHLIVVGEQNISVFFPSGPPQYR
jgi:hypothetical protein